MSTATVSFKTNILPMFRQVDIQHMAGMGVKLSDFSYMSDASSGSVMGCGPFPDHAHARAVYNSLTGACKQMPKGGPFWTPEQLQTYQQWMDGGFQP